MSDDNKRRINFAVVGGLAAAILVLIVLLTLNPASAGITGDMPPASGDWTINNPTTVIDSTVYIVDGNITVNSVLTVWNSEIYIDWSSNYDYYDLIVARGGTLNLNESTIESYWDYYDLHLHGTVTATHSDFNYVWNCTISGTVTGDDLEFYQVQKGIRNSGTITGNDTRFRYIREGLNSSGTMTMTYGYLYRIYGGINNTGTMTWDESEIWYVYSTGFLNTGTITMDHHYQYWVDGWYDDGTTTIVNSTIRYVYVWNVTGTLTCTNTTLWDMYNGINLMGKTTMSLCTFYYMHTGVSVYHDMVEIKDTRFLYGYDRGIYFEDCNATLDNVTIDVNYGMCTGYWKTGKPTSRDSKFPVAMGMGIWVRGGSPSFTDVDVETDSEAYFNIEYTGSEAEVRFYIQAMAAPVLIDSAEMRTVTGLTVHNSHWRFSSRVTATNPGANPQYFRVYFYGNSAGIGVLNYDDTTVHNVDVYDNRYDYINYPSVSGGSMYNYRSRSNGPRVQVGAAIFGGFASAPSPSFTLRDLTIPDGNDYFGHMYYPDYTGTGVPQFGDDLLLENLTVNTTSGGTFMRFEITSAFDGQRETMVDLEVTGCTFMGFTDRLMYYYMRPGPGLEPGENVVDVVEDVSFNNNTIVNCWYRYDYLYFEGVWYNLMNDDWDRTITIADNEYKDSWGTFWYAYGLEYFVKGSDTLNVLNNEMVNLTDQDNYDRGPFYTRYFDTINFVGNTLKDMHYGETGDFYDRGGDPIGSIPVDWLFQGNTWENCTNDRWAEVINLYFGGDVAFEDNEISQCNGLMSIMHHTEFTGFANLDLVDNKFHHNARYILEYGNVDEGQKLFTMTASGNEFYENEDYLFVYWGNTATITNFNRDGTFNIQNNTFRDNAGGLVHVWGDVTVRDNQFTDNAGPLLFIDYIELNVPRVLNNQLVDNDDLYVFIAKDRGYQLVSMEMKDETLSCTGTALSITNMDVTLDEVHITNAGTPIYAYNTFVNAYGCQINGSRCMVVSDGLISNWWPMEVKVTWGDKTGADSGTPVDSALLVFNDAFGDYYTSEQTNAMGMLARDIYPEWSVDLGGLHSYSPYTLKGAKSGVTNSMNVTLDRPLTGNDAVHLVLLDVLEPVMAITEPYDGAIFARDSLEAFGFVTEVGSGLASVEYSLDDGTTWNPLDIGLGGDWNLVMSALSDGEVTMMAKAMDVASNTNVTSVTVNIDTTPPALSVDAPSTPTNMSMLSITGTIEVGAALYIDGHFIRWVNTTALDEEYMLHEGENVIIVEAMDMAGNMETKELTVTLDTIAPVLVLTEPADQIMTNMEGVTFIGVVESGATLTVGGEQVIADEGTFSHDYMLTDGENAIEVKAIDAAGNAAIITRHVHMDQTPPMLEILSPDNGTKTSENMIEVNVSTEDDAEVTINGRMLPMMGSQDWKVMLLEGRNTITVVATDPVGNEATETIEVVRDTYPPMLRVTMPESTVVHTNAQTLTVEGETEGASEVRVGGNLADLRDDGTFTATVNLEVGTNNITIVATDGANEVMEKRKVMVDRTAPSLTVDEVPLSVDTPSVTITGTAPGADGVLVTYTGFNRTFPVDFEDRFAVTLNLPDGSYTVRISVTDVYGNDASESVTFEVKAKDYFPETGEGGGLSVEPAQIGLILAVIGIVLLIAAFWAASVISRRQREQLEEEM